MTWEYFENFFLYLKKFAIVVWFNVLLIYTSYLYNKKLYDVLCLIFSQLANPVQQLLLLPFGVSMRCIIARTYLYL